MVMLYVIISAIKKPSRKQKMNEGLSYYQNKPKTTWSQNKTSPTPCSLQSCQICLTPFYDQHNVTTLPCHQDHTFHQECLIRYFQAAVDSKKCFIIKCPLCHLKIVTPAIAPVVAVA